MPALIPAFIPTRALITVLHGCSSRSFVAAAATATAAATAAAAAAATATSQLQEGLGQMAAQHDLQVHR